MPKDSFVAEVAFKVGLSYFKKQRFLLHLKSPFCSQDIQIFVFTFGFGSCTKNGLIRKIR